MRLLVLPLSMLIITASAAAAVINVPANFDNIQAAINASSDGDEILVAPGTYTTETDDGVINPWGRQITIRATGTPEETIIYGVGQMGRKGVLCDNGEGADTIIEGFTILGGGEGIYCSYSSPTITGCTITGGGRAGIYCRGGSPTITGCTISDSSGGIYCFDSSPTIANCTISNNNAWPNGGGIFCRGGSPTITGCTIRSNTAANDGGGIYCNHDSSVMLINTVVCENAPDNIFGSWAGGGTCLADSCQDSDGNGVPDMCDDVGCYGDVAGNDQRVDGADLDAILLLWNQDADEVDLSGDGIIGIADLLMLLEAWGDCP